MSQHHYKKVIHCLNTKFSAFIGGLKGKSTEEVNDIISKAEDTQFYTVDDIKYQKRCRNNIPDTDRCYAKKSSGDRCSRRRKTNDSLFCGTHIKGTPHGVFNNHEDNNVKKIEYFDVDVSGIVYWVDNDGNVYNHDDIHSGKKNPRIITSYSKKSDGTYDISDY
jgi:hypothetical protein